MKENGWTVDTMRKVGVRAATFLAGLPLRKIFKKSKCSYSLSHHIYIVSMSKTRLKKLKDNITLTANLSPSSPLRN